MSILMPAPQLYNLNCIPGMGGEPHAVTAPGEAMRAVLAPEEVGCIITSIPFESLFQYSGKTEDVGNNPSTVDLRTGRFALEMIFVIEQMYRVLAPGRVACIHIQQLRRWKVQHGAMGLRDFRGAVVDLFQRPTPGRPGFVHVGEFSIDKNPQMVAKRMNLHNLMFETGRRDATDLAPTALDYVLVFKKPGENREPVRALYDARRPDWNPGGWLSLDEWVRDAHGVWTDIRETDVLEGYRSARESQDEKHVCPLQLTVIRRCKLLYTNAGDLILDPFMGIGSTACVAMEPRKLLRTGEEVQGNPAIGFELKESYHEKSVRYAAEMLEGRLNTREQAQTAMDFESHAFAVDVLGQEAAA